MKYRIITAALAITALLFCACNGSKEKDDSVNIKEEVKSTYANGNKKLVYLVIEGSNGKKILEGEKYYYENGNIQYEKHFSNETVPSGTWRFYYENGKLHAQGDFSQNHVKGANWAFYDMDSKPLFNDNYDSLVVLESTKDDHRPLSIVYYKGDEQHCFQFNDNYTINAKGMIKNGLREGRWETYYANGQMWTETIYSDGKKNGICNSYRQNGAPYYKGVYINDLKANVWEFYDEANTLVGTQDYDKH